MSEPIGDKRRIILNDKPDTQLRGEARVHFRQPPPMVDVDLGWGRLQAISIEEAEQLTYELIKILASVKDRTTEEINNAICAVQKVTK